VLVCDAAAPPLQLVLGCKLSGCAPVCSQDVPLGRLGASLGLLRLPHMPEVKKALMKHPSGGSAGCLEHFSPSHVDVATIKFKDKAREKQRQKVCPHWQRHIHVHAG